MKVGDKVRARDDDKIATIVYVNVKVRKGYTDTTYKALYSDGKVLKFRGCNIGKTVLKVEGEGQLSIFDYMESKGEK